MEEHVVIRFDPSDEEEEHLDFVVSSVKSKRKMTKARFETTVSYLAKVISGFGAGVLYRRIMYKGDGVCFPAGTVEDV
ncbi:hypothetical protein F2Q70_00001304 [Brassica cretica]|uniref:Uncharacterized protein n=1 Tax=Brassica cretica TaxID=69181 RepID=A0A3N6S2W1_BRACR|nr:hypothetical protein F2Q70_00001304 [Brassica cretica]